MSRYVGVDAVRFPGVLFYESQTRKDKCFYIVYKINGRLIREKIGWESQGFSPKLASQIRGERIRSDRLGEEVVPIQKQRKLRKTLNELAKDYFEWQEQNEKPRLYTDQKAYEKHVKGRMGGFPVKDISPFLLEKFKVELKGKDLAPATVRDILGLIRAIINRAIKFGHYDGLNPCCKVNMPKVSNERVRFLSPEEAQTLLEALRARSQALHDVALISLHTGLRFSEIARLQWKDIDLTNNTLYVSQSKNGHARTIPLTDTLKSAFQAMTRDEPGTLMFTGRAGRPLKEVSKTFERVVDLLGLNCGIADRRQRLCFHSLRHSCGSWLVQSGVPLYTVGKILGHRSSKMVERYGHLSPDSQQAAMRQMERAILTATNEKPDNVALQEK